MNRLPSGTIHARRSGSRISDGGDGRLESIRRAIRPSSLPGSCTSGAARSRPRESLTIDGAGPHEDSGAPQFAQNAAVVRLRKPQREHFAVEADSAVASEGDPGMVPAGSAAGGIAAPGGGFGIRVAQLDGGGPQVLPRGSPP